MLNDFCWYVSAATANLCQVPAAAAAITQAKQQSLTRCRRRAIAVLLGHGGADLLKVLLLHATDSSS